tara:strand:+ start:300 stop:587 length:288 start_codon:yes stop_codon:yes gene_type:complete
MSSKLANCQVLEASGSVTKHYFKGTKATLKEMQDLVGGNIELLSLDNNKVMVVNENGLNEQLNLNKAAMMYLYDFGYTEFPVVGDVIVVSKEFFD